MKKAMTSVHILLKIDRLFNLLILGGRDAKSASNPLARLSV